MKMEVQGDEQPSNIDLFYFPFWVRAYDLPLNGRNSLSAKLLGNKIGAGMDNSDEIGWGRYVRFRVLLDVRQPLI
jgi:hypothetical protein